MSRSSLPFHSTFFARVRAAWRLLTQPECFVPIQTIAPNTPKPLSSVGMPYSMPIERARLPDPPVDLAFVLNIDDAHSQVHNDNEDTPTSPTSGQPVVHYQMAFDYLSACFDALRHAQYERQTLCLHSSFVCVLELMVHHVLTHHQLPMLTDFPERPVDPLHPQAAYISSSPPSVSISYQSERMPLRVALLKMLDQTYLTGVLRFFCDQMRYFVIYQDEPQLELHLKSFDLLHQLIGVSDVPNALNYYHSSARIWQPVTLDCFEHLVHHNQQLSSLCAPLLHSTLNNDLLAHYLYHLPIDQIVSWCHLIAKIIYKTHQPPVRLDASGLMQEPPTEGSLPQSVFEQLSALNMPWLYRPLKPRVAAQLLSQGQFYYLRIYEQHFGKQVLLPITPACSPLNSSPVHSTVSNWAQASLFDPHCQTHACDDHCVSGTTDSPGPGPDPHQTAAYFDVHQPNWCGFDFLYLTLMEPQYNRFFAYRNGTLSADTARSIQTLMHAQSALYLRNQMSHSEYSLNAFSVQSSDSKKAIPKNSKRL